MQSTAEMGLGSQVLKSRWRVSNLGRRFDIDGEFDIDRRSDIEGK